MKLLLALFFLFTVPLFVFLATLLHGGISGQHIKTELNSSGIYSGIVTTMTETFTEENEVTAPDTSELAMMPFLKDRLTGSYLQTKTETLIDDLESWITGKSTIPPVLSFKEIKEDILAQNPELLTQLSSTMTDLKKEQAAMAESGDLSSEDMMAMQNFQQADPLEQLIKNDFSIPVGENLKGIKQGYQVMTILFPVLLILLALSILGIVMLNQTLPAKLRWAGITLLLSAVGGFVLTLINEAVLTVLKDTLVQNLDGLGATLAPVITGLLGIFTVKYKELQTYVSIIFVIISLPMIFASFFLKQSPPNPLPQPIKKSLTKKK